MEVKWVVRLGFQMEVQWEIQMQVLFEVQKVKAQRFLGQMDVGQIGLWLGVKPMLEMEGRKYMAVQNQKRCHSMVVKKELKKEVKYVHSEVMLQIYEVLQQ